MRPRLAMGPLLLALMGATVASAAVEDIDLQARIDAAADGATLTLAPGTYAGPLRIARPLTLEANGEVIVQGPGKGDVISITAPDVTLRGLVIRGTGTSLDRENSGVVGKAARITIEHCVFEDVLFGIYLKESPFAVVRGNRIGAKPLAQPRRGDAIRLWSSPDALIEDNVVRGSRDVIMWFSDRVLLRRNEVTGGRYGMHFMYSSQNTLEDNVLTDNSVGAFLMYSKDLTLRRNVFARNRGPSGFGVGLKDMDGLVAEDNLMIGNRVGLHLDNSPSSVGIKHRIRRNVIGYNDAGVAFLPMVQGNRFSENTFLENVEQVSILGSGELRGNDFAVDGRGNFWSDYRGFDLDEDGVGDTEYRANAFFENMIDREPRLRLFLFSPAQHALEMAARAFPIVAPRAKIVDPSPLLDPVPTTVETSPPASSAGVFAALFLLLLGVACLLPARSRDEGRLARSLAGDGAQVQPQRTEEVRP